jgi:polar amino acid transport system substrate-binding protein
MTMSTALARRFMPAAAALCLLVGAGCGSSSSGDTNTAAATNSAATTTGSTGAAQLPADIRKAGVLKVASDIPFPPYEFYAAGKNLTGLEVDLANAMAKELGVKAEFAQQPFDGVIPALQAHKYPIAMTAISDTKDREKVVDFVNYMYDSEAVLVPKGNPKHITGANTMCGMRLSVTRGTIQERNAKVFSKRCVKQGKAPISVAVYQSDGVSQLTVKSGKADGATSDAAALAYLAKTVDNGSSYDVVQYKDPQNPATPVGVAMAKGQDELRAAIEGAIKRVMASGEYQKILAKYGLVKLAAKDVTVNAAVN